MPLYEYKCPECGEKKEEYFSLKESDAKVKCPKCGKQMHKYFANQMIWNR